MFGRKKEDANSPATGEDDGAKALPLKTRRTGQTLVPPRDSGRFMRPEVVRPTFEVPRPGSMRSEHERSGYGEGKKLIVGRDIVLAGEINACEKLVVEGRVEANLTDCREIEISDTGTFKGEAVIDVAEISGRFDGSLTVRNLLIVRGSGRITGSVRYGRIEVERGGEITGDVQVLREPVAEEVSPAEPEAATSEQG